MNRNLLKLLENDARLTVDQLAVMLGADKNEVKNTIQQLEDDGVILGYKSVIDWEKTDREYVTAMIDVKLSPQRDRGFDKVAEKIFNSHSFLLRDRMKAP